MPTCGCGGGGHPGQRLVHEFGARCCGCCLVTPESAMRYGLLRWRGDVLSHEEKESVAGAGIDELIAMVHVANLRADLVTKIRYSA